MEQTKVEQQNTEQTALSSYSGSLTTGGHTFTSRLILGLGKYSLDLIQAAVKQVEAQITTLVLWRANEGGIASILDYVPSHATLLPNTSGARNAQEVVQIARFSREAGYGGFVKIEVIRDAKYLLPGNTGTAKTTEILAREGFMVMPYIYPGLSTARDPANAGTTCIIPLVAPTGTNRGLCTREFIQTLINEINLPIIVNAGVERPSQAYEAMEMGVTAIMASTAIATVDSVPAMAEVFKLAIGAKGQAYLAGLGRTLDKEASVSSPLIGFLHD